MSGPDTGGPPSGPKDRLLAGFDIAIGHAMAAVAPLSQLIRGDAMRGNPGTDPHPQPSNPASPPPPR